MKTENKYCAPGCEVVIVRFHGVLCGSLLEGTLSPSGYDDDGDLDVS